MSLQRLTADRPDCHLASAAKYCTVPESTVLLLTVSESTTVSATTADTTADAIAVSETTTDTNTTTVSGTTVTINYYQYFYGYDC